MQYVLQTSAIYPTQIGMPVAIAAMVHAPCLVGGVALPGSDASGDAVKK